MSNDVLTTNTASAELEVKEAFKALESFVAVYDPIALLSQLTLTFLFFPENEFQSEMSDVFVWQRYIELVAGILLIRPNPAENPAAVDGTTLMQLEKLLERYYNGISKWLMFETPQSPEAPERDLLLAEVKIESLYVRGEAYPHQFHSFARDLYGPHDEWFRKRYGFTIAEAIKLAESICDEYERRCNDSHKHAREEAGREAEELIRDNRASPDERRELEVRIGCALHFGQADTLLAFTAKELAEFSRIPNEICDRFLARMAQKFGHRNPDFPDTFTDTAMAPWDYNTLNERPIVTRGDGKYWVFVSPLLHSALFNTFYFDLMDDDSYRPVFEKARGDYVENRTAESLRRVFPPATTLLNPVNAKGEELADVMVLHDHKILLVQCKSKPLTYHARIGANFDALRSDMRKAIADAFQQGVKARDYLKRNEIATFTAKGIQFALDMSQVNEIYLVSVTGMPFQTLAARLANTNTALGLFPDMRYPWSLSLGDLEVVTQVLGTPAEFIHYVQRRRKVEATPFRLHADEMDYLGFYLSHGIDFADDQFKGMDAVGLSGFSDEIDRWVYEKFQLCHDVAPPRPPMPEGFSNFLEDVEGTCDEYRTDCAVALLSLGSAGRKQFMDMVEQTRMRSKQDGELHSLSLVLKGGRRGLSFLSLDANGDRTALFMQTAAFALMKKYQTNCDEWIGFGCDVTSAKAIDVAFFASYMWTRDEQVERLVKDTLRPGHRIEA
jgi:hypothetical protein